ncbi:MAG: tight adherence protein [Thermoleophilaceae bacterium]|nr:tight adherence protein [Thermoleophilaceae bacterium]
MTAAGGLAGVGAALAVAALGELGDVGGGAENGGREGGGARAGAWIPRLPGFGRMNGSDYGSDAERRAGSARAGRGAAAMRRLAATGGLALRIVRRPVGTAAPLGLRARIAAAGSPAGLGPREVMAAKLAAAAASGLVSVILAAPAPGRLGFLVAAAGPGAGFFAPDWWLVRRARERARRVRRDLPALLDLLRVSIEAGLSPVSALAAVGDRAGGPLAAEWRAVGREVALGVPLAEALDRAAWRLPLPEVRAVGAALERTARHGAPLSETLAAQAREARLSRRRQIEEEAARAGPKIQLVVALLLVPSVLLLVAAALAAALLDGGGLPIGH